MGKHGGAEFFEAFKRQREGNSQSNQSRYPLSDQQPDLESRISPPEENEQEAALDGSEPVLDDDEGTVPSVHVEVSGLAGRDDYQAPTPWTITIRASTFLAGLVFIGLSLVASYLIGQAHGKAHPSDVSNILGPAGQTPALSMPQNTSGTAPAPESANHKPDSQEPAPPAAQPSGKQWTLILAQYAPKSEPVAKETARRLQDEGFIDVGLARGPQMVYLYLGNYKARDDLKLQQYKELFSGRREFKNCFVAPLAFK